MQPLLIGIDSLSKKYRNSDRYSLQEVSLSVYAGEKFGVFGPNGAGKTTLISILCGLIPPSSGKVFYMKHGAVPARAMKSEIGFVPQEYSLYDGLTPIQNLEYFGALYNISRLRIKERTEELLHVLGLEQVANRKAKYFSGGMKRRLNLAIGIMHNPKVLFLDEPTVGVDIHSKNAIIKFLNTLNANGTTIVYTSHHLAEAEEFCDRIAILDRGSVVACDVLSHLLKTHGVADLQSAVIKLTGEAYRDHV